MTARQQIARLLPLVLLVILVVAGLRGEVAAPRWNGPLKADGVAIGLALEVILGALLIVTLRRDAAARRLAGRRPYSAEPPDLEPSAALRFTLRWVLGAAMVAVAVVLISDLHLHFLTKGKPAMPPPVKVRPKKPAPPPGAGGGGALHIPWVPILYGLLVVVLVAAVVISIWWSSRLRPLRRWSSRTRGPRNCGRRSSRGGPRWPRSATPGPRSSPATWRWSAAWPTGAPAAR